MQIEKIANFYEHIIWDWNGTIMDDLEFCVGLINDILLSENKPKLSNEEYQSIFTFPVIEYYKLAGLDTSEENFKFFAAATRVL